MVTLLLYLQCMRRYCSLLWTACQLQVLLVVPLAMLAHIINAPHRIRRDESSGAVGCSPAAYLLSWFCGVIVGIGAKAAAQSRTCC